MRILIVKDDTDIRVALAANLKAASYAVDIAEDG